MRIAEASIQELNERLDAVAVVGDYVRLEKRGGRYWGCCPFHNEKTPSFTVDPERKLYYCFGCRKGGSIINFVMEMDKLSFPEALEHLARKSGVELVREGRAEDSGEGVRAPSLKDDLYVLYERIAGSFHYLLTESAQGSAAKRYLLDRGLDAAMIERFRLGYAPGDRSWLFRFLSQKGYSPELLAASGLFSRNYPQSALFSGRLMFPIADRQGRIVAFGGRILEGEGPKYVNSPETEVYRKGQTLFALDLALPAIRSGKAVYLAEGYMDVIALHQAGITNAAAPLGTAFTEDQARLLKRWVDEVNLVFDADEAGQEAAVKGILTCRRNGLACRVLIPGKALARASAETPGEALAPEKAAPKDPADILRDFGSGLLQRTVKYTINDFEYLVERAGLRFNLAVPEGKAQGAAFLFPYAAAMDSDVARESCLENIADALGVGRESLKADFGRYRDGAVRGERKTEAPAPVRMNDELFLLAAVFINHGLYARFRSMLPLEELEDPGARELYLALEEWWRNEAPPPGEGGSLLPEGLLSRVSNEALKTFVFEQNAGGAFSGDPERLVTDSVKRLRQKRLARRQREIVIAMRTRKDQNGVSGRRTLEDLLAEKIHVDDELQRLQGNW